MIIMLSQDIQRDQIYLFTSYLDLFAILIALRPNEYEEAEGETDLQSGTSGTNSQEKQYIKSKETTLEIKRKFSEPGIEYKLVLYSYNMHNEDDFARLTWKIQCASPIVPDDWTLEYEPFLHTDTAFKFSLNIAKNKVRTENL